MEDCRAFLAGLARVLDVAPVSLLLLTLGDLFVWQFSLCFPTYPAFADCAPTGAIEAHACVGHVTVSLVFLELHSDQGLPGFPRRARTTS